MANYASLKAAIQQVVKTNGNNEITGALLQQSLLAMINSLGAYYQFVGIATPTTNPGTPDQNVYYLASVAGTYSNFNGIVLGQNEVAILAYNGSWKKFTSGFASQEMTDNLGRIVGDAYTVQSPGRIANGVWWSPDFPTTKHVIIPIFSGDEITITPNSSTATQYTLLSDYQTPVAGDTPSFATGYSDRITTAAAVSLVAPANARWLFLLSSSGAMPDSVIINGVERLTVHSTINAVDVATKGIIQLNTKKANVEDLQLLQLRVLPGAIMGSPYWEINGRFHWVIPVNGGDVVKYTSVNNNIYVAFLKSYVTPVYGVTPDYCSGYSGRTYFGTGTFTVPNDCRYLIVNNPLENTINVTSLIINDVQYINGVAPAIFDISKRTTQIENTIGTFPETFVKKTDVTIVVVSANLADPAGIVDGRFVNSSGTIGISSDWSLIKIPVTGGKTYTFGGFYLGRSGYGVYQDANGNYLTNTLIHYNDPNGRENPQTYTAPANAAYLLIDIRSNLSPADPYSNLQINEGTILRGYDEYKENVTKILGDELAAKDTELREQFNAYVLREPPHITSLEYSGFVRYSDGKRYSGGYRTSAFIKVNPGETIIVNQIYASSTVATLAAYSTNDETGYIQNQSVIGTNGFASYEYVVPNGVSYIRLCCNSTPQYIENFYYGIIPVVPYIPESRIATSLADSPDKIPTIGLLGNISGRLQKTIRLYPQTKLPCVSFQFDDIPAKDSQLVTLFQSYGLVCGFAFIASQANITSKAATYLEYQKAGFQILNHSVDGTIFNTTNYTYATAMAAIMTALNRIQNAGMVCNGFVSPSSAMATEFLPILKAAQAYAFTSATTSPTANGRNQDTCQLHRYSLQSNTLAQIEQYIDDCITNDQIMTFYGHAADLVDGGDSSVFSLAKIAAVIEYCIGKRDSGLLYIGGTDDCVKYFFDL